MNLKDIKECRMCKSTKLELKKSLTIDDVDNDGEMVVDAKVCECGTIHFIENKLIAYQFYPSQISYQWVAQVSDQELALMK